MKKTILCLSLLIILLTTNGCLKKDTMENISIYTTSYPIEYITTNLYGENGTINSIYPDSTDITDYKLTNKQIADYSESDLYVYNGLSNEKDYAIKMLNNNKNLKIIDSAISMEYDNEMAELWLDPSNFLMLAQNIRNGFKEYITNPYLKNEIDENYEKLKIEISEIDAELKLIAENANNKTIVVSDDLFQFLEKYNMTVISLEENDELTDKKIDDVKKLISNGTIKYIFTKNNETVNNTIKNLVDNYEIEILTFNTGSNLTEEQRSEKINFITIMLDNIESLKRELYQ